MSKIKAKLENFWYYYKWHTLIGVFLAAVAAFSVWQFVTAEDYDYTVMLYTSRSTTSALSQALENTLEQVGGDLNGDGKVSVQVINVSYSDMEQDKGFKISQAQALRGELLSDRCFLCITDDTRFSQINKEGYFERLSELPDNGGLAYRADDGKRLGQMIINEYKKMNYSYYGDVENGLNFSLRYSNDNSNRQAQTRREQQKQLLFKIMEVG